MAAGLKPVAPMDPDSARAHALEVLEYGAVLEWIARRATSEPGRRHVLALRPAVDLPVVQESLLSVEEMSCLLLGKGEWVPPPIPDVEGALRRLHVEGTVLDVEALADIGILLSSSRLCHAFLREASESSPRLATRAAGLAREPDLEGLLERALDPPGGVSDAASPALKRIRRSLRGGREALVRRLDAFARSLPAEFRVPDASVTVRGGRYCIPLRREGLSYVKGIVHDESATHRTMFVEPPMAIEPMNRVAELEREEVREIERILRQLTETIRPHEAKLERALHALAEIDSLHARARYAQEHGGVRPDVRAFGGEVAGGREEGDAGEIWLSLERAVHPLLLAGGESVVPFDLELRTGESVLLVSGPNAGGKTVLLKAIGLLSVMAQSGIVPPVGPGTTLPAFRSVFALIGDEQSIQASLSTFSAHVEGLRTILEHAGRDALVLIDELGGSTDPAEGAALAAAVLLQLAEQAGLTVATTHLGALKQLASERRAIVNASLQFDRRALRPTFRFRRDRPGNSYALEISRRLGLPEHLLAQARARLPGREQDVERLLTELDEKEEELSRRLSEVEKRRERLKAAEQEAEQLLVRIRERERRLEREGVARAERYLLEARRHVGDVIRRLEDDVRESSSAVDRLREAGREARAEVERLVRRAKERRHEGESNSPDAEPVEIGDAVRSRTLDVEGRVVERRVDAVVLEAGGLRFEVPAGDVHRLERPAVRRAPPPGNALLPEVVPRPEVDLRGLRVDEVERALTAALDAAVLGELCTVRVIHGKGTGALRDAVRRLLEGDDRVAGFRTGGFEEGGSGVTVVEFRKNDE